MRGLPVLNLDILSAAVTSESGAVTGASGGPLLPMLVLGLCVLAGVGTWLALPGRRDVSWSQVGGTLVPLCGVILAVAMVRWAASRTDVKTASYVYFWIFSAVALFSSLRVVTHRKPVYSALYFVLAVFATAGMFLLMWAEFMAAALVLIYAGAILVTYVFVIMLASEASTGTGANAGIADHDGRSREPFMASVAGFGFMGVLLFVIFDRSVTIPMNNLGGAPSDIVTGHTQQLGAFLFKYHFVNVQLAGLILTLAMVGAIMIARKKIVHLSDSEAELASAVSPVDAVEEMVLGPATPVSDDPHSIPVEGTTNPRQKAYPEF